jgi:exodeoxyribonuclease-3
MTNSAHQSLISWNVNGIRSVLQKGFREFLTEENAAVIALQETKVDASLTDGFVFSDYPYRYWNCAVKKGYSGTAILSKTQPLKVNFGLGSFLDDQEGRVITAEFCDYYLVNVYTPNSQDGLRRLDYRCGVWDIAFRQYLHHLETHKPVVFCGDLNVAHQEIDLARPATNRRNPGFTDEERAEFGRHLGEGRFVDTFRWRYPQARDHYTWWSYRGGARERNVGWRIDYFCISKQLTGQIIDAAILDQRYGSDHCPVKLVLGK